MEARVTFTSRTLSPTEKKHAQLEKEALAMVFGITNVIEFISIQFNDANTPSHLMTVYSGCNQVWLCVVTGCRGGLSDKSCHRGLTSKVG